MHLSFARDSLAEELLLNIWLANQFSFHSHRPTILHVFLGIALPQYAATTLHQKQCNLTLRNFIHSTESLKESNYSAGAFISVFTNGTIIQIYYDRAKP